MAGHFDVVIVGAGISGINAAYRIQSAFPHLSYIILEARDAIGGTWDLFRYPGIRSDSDLFTFGFEWYPWNQDNPIADGPSIVQYMRKAASCYGIDKKVVFRHRVMAVDWSSQDHIWTFNIDNNSKERTSATARFLIFGTGYYDYHKPLQASIPHLDLFQGQVIHPQFWPDDLKFEDKKFIVIGSGATAITLVPKLADKGANVTMLQRSPTYILSIPNKGRSWLSYILPNTYYRRLQRLYLILTSRLFFLFCRTFPSSARAMLRSHVQSLLPKNVSYDQHFRPRYNPWEQRLCVCPDGDFFNSLHTGRVQIKTDTIRTVTSSGIELSSGEHLVADAIVTATGLRLQVAGGVHISIDGLPHNMPSKFLWRGIMQQDLPNAAFVLGYSNASWTLGADATAQFICRLLGELDRRDAKAVVPRLSPSEAKVLEPRPFLDLTSTYVINAVNDLPQAGNIGPWQPRDHYWKDLSFAQKGNMDEGLEFLV